MVQRREKITFIAFLVAFEHGFNIGSLMGDNTIAYNMLSFITVQNNLLTNNYQMT